MSTSIGIGFSQDADPKEAVLKACIQAKNELNSNETDLIIAFATPSYAVPEFLPVITRTLKPKHLIGSSTGGIILTNGMTNRGIAIAGINSDDFSLGVSAINMTENIDMHTAGFDLAQQAVKNLKMARRDTFTNTYRKDLFIIFSQGLEKNSSQFILGVKEVLGKGFPLIGAVSSDDFKYKRLSQFFQDQVLHHSSICLLLGGSELLSVGCAHGFKPLGKPRKATKVDGMVLKTIDDKPALEIYKHYLGQDAENFKNAPLNSYAALYPLGIYLEESRQYLLRNIIDILKDGSIVCHEGIPEGAEIHLMISNKDSCLKSATEAAWLVKESLSGKTPRLLLIFESLARHKILGGSAFLEVQAIKDVLGANIPILGMCSYGELGPFNSLSSIKNLYLHNESILIAAVA